MLLLAIQDTFGMIQDQTMCAQNVTMLAEELMEMVVVMVLLLLANHAQKAIMITQVIVMHVPKVTVLPALQIHARHVRRDTGLPLLTPARHAQTLTALPVIPIKTFVKAVKKNLLWLTLLTGVLSVPMIQPGLLPKLMNTTRNGAQ
eukprot:TRINITY_DN4318_c0_g2_i1.p1 TRINITY_DN4318_c0_g2~~TRINITY_DN4318_c0_g2_i1.p1  ORF type:complete len:146 (+),score=12.89 TRINITY_DN4318_c0_g2_i1:48-485(+)